MRHRGCTFIPVALWASMLIQASAAGGERADDARFAAIASQVHQHLDAHRLDAAHQALTRLALIPDRRYDVEILERRVNEREAAIAGLLGNAARHRANGAYDAAIREIVKAEAIAVDRPSLAQERRALQTEQHVINDVAEGDRAIRAGEVENAIIAYERALTRRADADVADTLKNARIMKARRDFNIALRDDALREAIKIGRAWQRLEPDDERARIIAQLEAEFIAEARRQAQAAVDAGNTAVAPEIIRAALAHVHDEALVSHLARLRSTALLTAAIAADQSGDVLLARELYLDALRHHPGEAGLVARIDDTQLVAQAQADRDEAERNAIRAARQLTSIESELHRAEKAIRDQNDDLREIERVLRDYDRTTQLYERKLKDADRVIYDLECDIDRLNSTVRRLERDLHRAERDRHRPKH